MDEVAADAMAVSAPGRTWRPLQDTADSAPFLYTAGGGWAGWRRSTDFYEEGTLIWLEADVTIRRLTGGQKTLDDFCALFHGAGRQRPGLGEALHGDGRLRGAEQGRAIRLEGRSSRRA